MDIIYLQQARVIGADKDFDEFLEPLRVEKKPKFLYKFLSQRWNDQRCYHIRKFMHVTGKEEGKGYISTRSGISLDRSEFLDLCTFLPEIYIDVVRKGYALSVFEYECIQSAVSLIINKDLETAKLEGLIQAAIEGNELGKAHLAFARHHKTKISENASRVFGLTHNEHMAAYARSFVVKNFSGKTGYFTEQFDKAEIAEVEKRKKEEEEQQQARRREERSSGGKRRKKNNATGSQNEQEDIFPNDPDFSAAAADFTMPRLVPQVPSNNDGSTNGNDVTNS